MSLSKQDLVDINDLQSKTTLGTKFMVIIGTTVLSLLIFFVLVKLIFKINAFMDGVLLGYGIIIVCLLLWVLLEFIKNTGDAQLRIKAIAKKIEKTRKELKKGDSK